MRPPHHLEPYKRTDAIRCDLQGRRRDPSGAEQVPQPRGSTTVLRSRPSPRSRSPRSALLPPSTGRKRPSADVVVIQGWRRSTVDRLPVPLRERGRITIATALTTPSSGEMPDKRRSRDQHAARGHGQGRSRPCQRGTLARQAWIVRIGWRRDGPASRVRLRAIQWTSRSTTARMPPHTAMAAIPGVSTRGIHE